MVAGNPAITRVASGRCEALTAIAWPLTAGEVAMACTRSTDTTRATTPWDPILLGLGTLRPSQAARIAVSTTRFRRHLPTHTATQTTTRAVRYLKTPPTRRREDMEGPCRTLAEIVVRYHSATPAAAATCLLHREAAFPRTLSLRRKRGGAGLSVLLAKRSSRELLSTTRTGYDGGHTIESAVMGLILLCLLRAVWDGN